MTQEEIKMIHESIAVDENLEPMQRVFLCAFFELGYVIGRITKTCAMTGVAYNEYYRWKKNEHFNKWINTVDDLVIQDAEQALFHLSMREGGNLEAIKLILTKLSPKWKDKVDITTGGDRISSIKIGLLDDKS